MDINNIRKFLLILMIVSSQLSYSYNAYPSNYNVPGYKMGNFIVSPGNSNGKNNSNFPYGTNVQLTLKSILQGNSFEGHIMVYECPEEETFRVNCRYYSTVKNITNLDTGISLSFSARENNDFKYIRIYFERNLMTDWFTTLKKDSLLSSPKYRFDNRNLYLLFQVY